MRENAVLNKTIKLRERVEEITYVHTSQCQCQRGEGCKMSYKTWKELDNHIQIFSYNSEICQSRCEAEMAEGLTTLLMVFVVEV